MKAIRLSVNLESAEDLTVCAKSYHPTGLAIEFIDSLANAALKGGEAHALLGPYGAGKSSLAAFALNQLSCPTSFFVPYRARDSFPEESVVAKLLESGGLAPITVVGASESLAYRVTCAMSVFAQSMGMSLGESTLKPFADLHSDNVTSEQALRLVVRTTQEARRTGLAGVLLVIDEFGRHLDHMAATASDADFHFLQSLAELTGRTESPLSLLIIQHFGLEHYSRRFFGDRRVEWEKVRGRFRETILHNTETDTAHIIARALQSLHQGDAEKLKFSKPAGSSPKLLQDSRFMAAASNCRPLHPMTIVLLSRLARLLGQQDRTVVGWLTSDLATGFDAQHRRAGDDWIYPHSLFEHFFGDALLVPSNPALAMRFAAIHAARERVGDRVTADARTLLQIIAMLNFVAGRGLSADKVSALACLPTGFPFEKCIAELTESSLVVYRRYRDEYAIWDGSDYDVARKVDQEIAAANLDMAAEMNRVAARTILAHSHFIQTGNRRGAKVYWLRTEDEPPDAEGRPRILIYVGGQKPPDSAAIDVTGITNSRLLEPHLKEVSAIQSLLTDDASLIHDEVAKKEMRLRQDFHKARVSALCDELLESDLQWQVEEARYPSLQKAISAAMDRAYPRAFPLHNDLINKDKVSGQVTAALRKLLEHLHTDIDKENLGITKFPAERIIYQSLLRQSGLHTSQNQTWNLQLDEKNLPQAYQPVINEIRKHYLESGHGSGLSIDEVVTILSKPPFGVNRVPAILLCILVVVADRDSHEVYEDHQYVPRWGPQTLLRMLKAPSRFSVTATTKIPISESFLAAYRKALIDKGGAKANHAPVAIARDLLIRHSALSAYARHTTTVSESAQAFRRALSVAKSPGDMLFHTIPSALGYSSPPSAGIDLRSFLSSVKRVQAELEGADAALLQRLEDVTVDTLACESLEAARAHCTKFAMCLMSKRQMYHGYHEFLSQVLNESVSDDRRWLAGVVSEGLGITLPITSWNDSHATQAEFLLRQSVLGLESAGQLVANGQVHQSSAPFAVFWPNQRVASARNDIEDFVRRLSSIVDEVPEDFRLTVVTDLARSLREDV